MSSPVDYSQAELLDELQHLRKLANRLLQLEYISFDAIKNNDLTTTEAILDQRQALINDLLAVRQLRNTYDQRVLSNQSNQSPTIEATLKEIDNALHSIRQTEQEMISFVRDQHRALAGELQAMVKNQLASKSYQSPKPSSSSGRIDISG